MANNWPNLKQEYEVYFTIVFQSKKKTISVTVITPLEKYTDW